MCKDILGSAASLTEKPCPDLREPWWEWWRSQMPICHNWAYFDHAAVAPLPRPTAERLADLAHQASSHGDTIWPEWSREIEEMRTSVSQWIGASSDEIAFIPNTTYGINLVAEGLPWQPGDNIVVPGGEFPSNLLPWLNQKDRGVEVRIIGSADEPADLDRLANAIDDSTRLVAASWVGYANGFRIDLDRLVDIAHRRGALVFLDAIQGMGLFPLNVSQTPIDFLSADSHKWMLGPEGAGIAFVRRQHLDRLRCRVVGWNSVCDRHHFENARLELRPEAARFEGGSANMLGLLAMHRSLQIFWKLIESQGPDAIADRILRLTAKSKQRLSEAGAEVQMAPNEENQSGIVPFCVPGIEPARVRQACLDAAVVVSCRGGAVRMSVHAYNNDDEIQKLADVVKSLVS